jgi:NADH dehydrogenase
MMTSRNEPTRVPHVVIVGGGFGGLAAVRALRREPVNVNVAQPRR